SGLSFQSLKKNNALSEPEICYVLDGILFLYGIILTALYCRIKGIYTVSPRSSGNAAWGRTLKLSVCVQGLTPHATDTYETIGMKK
uniref:Uncharacterized protein n=1 Tax=Oryzias latipes TaxID=8090 RepID=A0A3B3I8S6_ORYLA